MSSFSIQYSNLGRTSIPTVKKRSGQSGLIRHGLLLAVIITVGLLASFRIMGAHAAAAGYSIKSGVSGLCLDLYHDHIAPGPLVDIWHCNGSQAQNWHLTTTAVHYGSSYCLGVANNSTRSGSQVNLYPCSDASGQVWLQDKRQLLNPNSGLCLSVPKSGPGQKLITARCKNSIDQTWLPSSGQFTDNSSCNNGSEGQRVACVAVEQWEKWQSGNIGHNILLNKYTDGNSYEEWCADFVSYVYKQAGYPFSGGERNGWDEYWAPNIQNQGFSVHASSSYIPQAGDVGFFNYLGGHVEIVISGGKQPTFIYGDSHIIDPTTGNGDMATNTIVNDGPMGSLQYYLSPN